MYIQAKMGCNCEYPSFKTSSTQLLILDVDISAKAVEIFWQTEDEDSSPAVRKNIL